MALMDVYNNSNITNSISFNSIQLKDTIAKAKNGEDRAFTELYNSYFEKIYRFVYYRVSHKEIAEDITEEIFIRAFQNLTSLSQEELFEGWLYQIARNRVIDYYRSKKMVVALDEVENSLEYESNIVDSVNLQMEQKALLRCLKELPPDQQQVIKLKFIEKLENNEIASIMDKNEGSIRVIQHRAINRLKELIEQLTNSNN